MESILAKYVDAKARVKYLEHSIKKTEEKIERLETTDYGYVSDVVACGKKRRKPLKTVKVTGYNIDADRKLHGTLTTKRVLLRTQEEKLLENPILLRAPIVRNDRAATVGYCPEIWKDWK